MATSRAKTPKVELPPPGDRRLGRLVPGDGPMPCRVMIVSEMPGTDEISRGRPMVGRAGQELERYMDGDRLPFRIDCYITNIGKQLPRRPKKGLDAEEIAYWLPELLDEIDVVNPDVIIAMGAPASRVFIPDAVLERIHGLAHAWKDRHGKDRIVVPTYNPAATLHSPEVQSLFSADMDAIGRGLSRGFRLRRVDDVPTRYAHLPLDGRIPREFSIDTEGWPDEPWCLTISWKAGEAFIVYATDKVRLRKIKRAVRRARRVTCQGLLADLEMLDSLGKIDIPEDAMDDTQIMLYLLGLEPQGLKDASYRHLGAEQEDYTDVTADAEQSMVTGYINIIRLTHHNTRVVKSCERILKKIADGNTTPAKKLWSNSKFSKVVDPPPRVTLDMVRPKRRAVVYACRDADLTERLRPIVYKMICDRRLEKVYALDMGVIPVVNRMQHVGMRVIPEHFSSLLERFDKEYFDVHAQLAKVVGHDLNPNSAPQVQNFLFGKLRLSTQGIKRTAHGHSTQDKYLEAMRGAHPSIGLIVDARELVKLKSAYAAAILKTMIETEDGFFVFPHLRITRVVSGRVSAFDPNVLAIPKHSARGKLIRLGFTAGDGRLLLSIDLSQIELRVAAHECQDREMLAVFRKGLDLHAALGYRIFGVKPEDQDDSKHRLPMKKANFGYWMGISAKGMSDQLIAAGASEWTEDRCQEVMDELDRVWPGAPAYKDAKIAQARRLGYVTDFLGRRRYLAGVHSPDNRVRGEAERQAHATPIQSGAQEIFKTWMGRIWKTVMLEERKAKHPRYCEPWLQVHDDFICEVDIQIKDRVQGKILACIPQMLSVPTQAKPKSGVLWGNI